jgi:hypothetical protein
MRKKKLTKAEREEMDARHARIEARYEWLREHIAKRHAERDEQSRRDAP